MTVGLFLNQLFRSLNLPRPLATLPVLAVLFGLCLVASEVALRRNNRSWEVRSSADSGLWNWCALLAAALIPLVSVAGTVQLNTGGTGHVAVGAVLLIAAYTFIVVLTSGRIAPSTLAFSLVMISLAMLLSFSLRSGHIVGWDINQEFYVFQLAQANQAWLLEAFRDPYNACLSITILPTISNSVLGINDEYVFKLVYQLLFATVPLAVFVTARKYVPPVYAYLASLFFVFQPWFIQPMPALARQQIGLLFFALFTWIAFQRRFPPWQKNTLLLAFGASLIVSHYSTSYIALGMLTLTAISFEVAKRLSSFSNAPQRTSLISGWVLLTLFGLTFYWSSILTRTSGNVVYIARSTLSNMRNALLSDLRSEDIRLTLGLGSGRFGVADLRNYAAAEAERHSDQTGLYSPDTYQGFALRIVTSQKLEGVIGSGALRTGLTLGLLIIKQLTKLLLVLGAVVLLLRAFKARGLDPDFALLNLTSMSILFLFMLLPVLSLYYNLYRVYVQMLVVSCVSLVIGGDFALSAVPTITGRAQIIVVILLVFFIASSGVAALVTGGPATMNLNNRGEEYDKFYAHEEEVAAASWLSAARDPGIPVYADETAALRLISFGNGLVQVNNAILPSTLTREGYIYLDYANVHLGIVYAHIGGTQISYNYPQEFLAGNKNKIYDNGGAQIFK
jgi:uncharacterized membrane protein